MANKLLIIDLDETLFHATKSKLKAKQDFMVANYFVYKRPDVDEFLKFCKTHFKLAVWTSSTEDYANAMLKELQLDGGELEFVFHREQCISSIDYISYETTYIKDLKKLKKMGFNLDYVVALDDSPEKLKRNYGNLLRIKPFVGDADDKELLLIIPFLKMLAGSENIRTIEKRNWRGQDTNSSG